MLEPGRESEPWGRFLDQARADAALAALGSRQHAVFELGQVLHLGLTARAVQKRAAAGRLHRIHHRVYSLVPRDLLSRGGLYMAAVLACGPDAVLSHRSAAALHELVSSGGMKIDVTVASRSARAHAGVALHRSTTLAAADATRVQGIPCTTVARTLFDLGEVLDRRRLERAFDQAEILEVFDLRALQDQISHNRTRGGGRLVQAVLNEHYVGRTPTWSDLEEALLRLTRAVGLPDPEVNAWLLPDDGPAVRIDFIWRAQRVAVETDGHETHRTRQAFERDRRRDQRLAAAGWRPIRVTWRQIMRTPEQVSATLAALLKR